MRNLTVAIVLGNKLDPKGEPTKQLRKRTKIGVECLKSQSADYLLLTGGQTRRMMRSESDAALTCVPVWYQDRVVREQHSRTTRQNIRNAKRHVRVSIERRFGPVGRVIIIGSATQEPRVSILMRRFWPDMPFTFISVEPMPFWGRWMEGCMIVAEKWGFGALLDPVVMLFR